MRRLRGAGAGALRAVLITMLLGAWLDAGAWAAMRQIAAGHCGETSQMTHHTGLAVASPGAGSHQDCGGGPCLLVRHCGGSVNGTFVFDPARGPSLTPVCDARLPIASLWMPRTRHIAPPTPPPLSPLVVTA